jgi:AcrR family transcriptional regulator
MSDKGTQTRNNIVEKSLQLFSVKGYFNTSIADILEATNLTKGGLYGHFRSKEDIWYAVYDRAVMIWRGIVFRNMRKVEDPLERIAKTIEADLREYLGDGTFEGGCFFLNMLVELSGQSASMSKHIVKGFIRFSRLLCRWLEDGMKKGILKDGVDCREAADFIVISLNGAAALFSATRDPIILNETANQLRLYVNQLRKA